jgi:hypothetical protein
MKLRLFLFALIVAAMSSFTQADAKGGKGWGGGKGGGWSNHHGGHWGGGDYDDGGCYWTNWHGRMHWVCD